MNDELEQNLLSLPDYALNSEILFLETRVECCISTVLEYACQSWHSHLTETRGDITDLIPDPQFFLETNSWLGWKWSAF